MKGDEIGVTPKRGPGRPPKKVSLGGANATAVEATPKTPSKAATALSEEAAVEAIVDADVEAAVDAAVGAAIETPVKRKAGRPPGSTNSKKYEHIVPRRGTRERK